MARRRQRVQQALAEMRAQATGLDIVAADFDRLVYGAYTCIKR